MQAALRIYKSNHWKVSAVSPNYHPGTCLETTFAWLNLRWPSLDHWRFRTHWVFLLAMWTSRYLPWEIRGLGNSPLGAEKKNPQTPYIFRKKNRRNQRFDCSVWPLQTSLKRWIDICLDHVCVSSSCPHLSSAHLSQTLLPHSLAISCQGQPGPQSCQNWKSILCPCLLLFSKNAP